MGEDIQKYQKLGPTEVGLAANDFKVSSILLKRFLFFSNYHKMNSYKFNKLIINRYNWSSVESW